MNYSAHRYKADLLGGAAMAFAFTMIAAVPLGLMGIVTLVETIRGRPLELSWGTYAAICLVVPGSYFLAALVGGTVVFLLRPLRAWWLGWALTGAGISASAYGSVGVALAVFYDPVGRTMLKDSTQAELWHMIPFMIAVLSPIGALGGIYWRSKNGSTDGV